MRREALDSASSSSARLSQVFLIFFFAIGERIRAPHGFGSRGFGTRVRLSLLAALGPGSKLGHTPSNSTYMRDACFPEGFQFSSLPAGFLLSFSERFYAFLGEEDRSPEMGERELSALPFEFELTCAGAGSVRGIPIGCTALLLERQAGRQGLDQVWFLNFSYKFSHIVY